MFETFIGRPCQQPPTGMLISGHRQSAIRRAEPETFDPNQDGSKPIFPIAGLEDDLFIFSIPGMNQTQIDQCFWGWNHQPETQSFLVKGFLFSLTQLHSPSATAVPSEMRGLSVCLSRRLDMSKKLCIHLRHVWSLLSCRIEGCARKVIREIQQLPSLFDAL